MDDDDSASYEYYTIRNEEDESFVGINDILNLPSMMTEENNQVFYLTFGNETEEDTKEPQNLIDCTAKQEEENMLLDNQQALEMNSDQDVKLITLDIDLEGGQMFMTTGANLDTMLNNPPDTQEIPQDATNIENDLVTPQFDEDDALESNFQLLELPDGSRAIVKIVKVKDEPTPQVTKEEPPKKQKKFQCRHEGCDKFYATSYHLTVHMRTHTDCKPYQCYMEGCEKKFSTNYSLKAHTRTHTGEKPYPCPQCAKKFKTSGDLQKHVRIHTGEKPFMCPIEGCGKSFTTSNIRKVHIRSHTGERPYTCTHVDCGKSFTSSTNYKNHMRIHSGEKPYICSECNKCFTEYSSLYKHHSVHQPVRPCLCIFCGQRFKQESALNFHKRLKHNVVVTKDGTEIIVKIE